MPSLRDILNKQKADKEKANASKEKIKSEQSQHEIKSSLEKEQGQSSIQDDKTNPNEGRGKEVQLVNEEPKRNLSFAERMAARKVGNNAITQSPKNSISVGTTSIPKDVAKVETVISEDRQLRDEPSKEKHENKTNDGNVDVEKLRDNLTYLANNIEQKELVGQVVRTIAVQIKNNPSLQPFMSNADVDLFVRGMRSAYTIAARKKQEATEGRKKSVAGSDELKALMKSAGLDAFNLKMN